MRRYYEIAPLAADEALSASERRWIGFWSGLIGGLITGLGMLVVGWLS